MVRQAPRRRDTLAGFLDDHRAEHEHRLAEYRGFIDAVADSDTADPHVGAVVEFGIAYEEAFLGWLAHIATRFTSRALITPGATDPRPSSVGNPRAQRRNRPGRAPVGEPSRVATTPFTTLATTPAASVTKRVPPAGWSRT